MFIEGGSGGARAWFSLFHPFQDICVVLLQHRARWGLYVLKYPAKRRPKKTRRSLVSVVAWIPPASGRARVASRPVCVDFGVFDVGMR